MGEARRRREAVVATSRLRPQDGRDHYMLFDVRTHAGKSFVIGFGLGRTEAGEVLFNSGIGEEVLLRLSLSCSGEQAPILVELAEIDNLRERVTTVLASAPDDSRIMILGHEDHLTAVAMRLIGPGP